MSEINPNTATSPDEGMRFNQYAIFYLGKAARWARFIAIIGFILSAVVAIAGFCVGSSITQSPGSPLAAYTSGTGVILTSVYSAAALVSFIIHLFLYQFANRSLAALMVKDADMMGRAMHKLQSFFKAVGVVIVVNFILTILALVYVFLIMGR